MKLIFNSKSILLSIITAVHKILLEYFAKHCPSAQLAYELRVFGLHAYVGCKFCVVYRNGFAVPVENRWAAASFRCIDEILQLVTCRLMHFSHSERIGLVWVMDLLLNTVYLVPLPVHGTAIESTLEYMLVRRVARNLVRG